MLSTIKKYINDLPNQNFLSYYNLYIMDMQDKNIDRELSYLLAANNLNILNMSKLIKHTFEGINSL